MKAVVVPFLFFFIPGGDHERLAFFRFPAQIEFFFFARQPAFLIVTADYVSLESLLLGQQLTPPPFVIRDLIWPPDPLKIIRTPLSFF